MRQFLRTVFCSVLFLSLSHLGIAQVSTVNQIPKYKQMIQDADNSTSFKDIQLEAEAYFDGKDKGRGSGYKQYKRWEQFMMHRLDDSGNMINYTAKVWDEYQRLFKSPGSAPGGAPGPGGAPPVPPPPISCTGPTWSVLGPDAYINGASGYNPGLGRVNVITFHPTNANTIYFGAPAGGLWKTADGGSTWTPLTDNLTSIGVSGIAINPSNPNNIFILTGDGDGGQTYSIGVLESTDGGVTWNSTGFSFATSSLERGYKLRMDPSNPNIMFAAFSTGLYRTTDGWATWSKVINDNMRDVEFQPGNSNVVYATTNNDFYRSSDNGATWGAIDDQLLGTNRIEVAVSPASPLWVYLLSGPSTGVGSFTGTSLSTDGGLTFSASGNTPNILGYSSSGTDNSNQSWYDLAVAASPTNPFEVITGGINVWKSTDAMGSFSNISQWVYGGSQYTHADIHELVFNPLDNKLYCGSDGGIFVSTDFGNTWTDLSGGIIITQFYRIADTEANPNLVIGGTQDNGSNTWNGTNTITHIYGADGMDCMIDYTNSNILYYSTQFGNLRRSTNGGATASDISPFGGNWITPFGMDPATPTTIYAGWGSLYQSTNSGGAWTNTGMPCADGMAICESNGQVIYTSSGSQCYVTTNAGGSNTNISAGLPSRTITYVTVNPNDGNEAWVSYGGFGATEKVYRTVDGGSNWTNMSSGLPNVPINCIIQVDDVAAGYPTGAVYVGTDLGVWYRDDVTAWTCVSDGLPTVPIYDIEINYAASLVRAGTFGRGLWEAPMMACNPPTITCTSNITVNTDPGVCEGTVNFPSQMVLQYNPVGNIGLHSPVPVSYVDPSYSASNLTQSGYPNNWSLANSWPVGYVTTSGTVNTAQYITFDITVPAGTDLDRVQYAAYSYNGGGSYQAAIRSSLDGFATDVDLISGSASFGSELVFDLSSLSTFNVETNVTFRIYFWDMPTSNDWILLRSTALGVPGNGLRVYANSLATATSDCGLASLTYSGIPADYVFPEGTTTVTATATDINGNTATCSFDVTVVDNESPTILSEPCGVSNANGAAYGDGFQTGDNDGSGFGSWALTTTSGNGSENGHFRFLSISNGDGDNNGDGDIDNGGFSWGTYANSGQKTEAFRPLSNPMMPGSRLYAEIDNGWLDPGAFAGVKLFDGSGNYLWGFGFTGGSSEYIFDQQGGPVGSGIPFTDEGIAIEIVALSLTSIEATITPLNGPGATTVTSNLINPGPIEEVMFENFNAGAGGPFDFYFNNLEVCYAGCAEPDTIIADAGVCTGTMPDMTTSLGTWDNCTSGSLSQDPAPGSAVPVGTSTVTITATDVDGNTTTCQSTITVEDNEPPVAVCKNDTVYLDANGVAYLTPSMFDGGSTDNCGIDSMAIHRDSVTCENLAYNLDPPGPRGRNVIYFTVWDEAGNTSSCFAQVTVFDTTSPTALCKDITVALDASGNASITPKDIDDGSTDNCYIVKWNISQSSFTCADIGANTVILTVTDTSGNTAACLSTVTIVDNTPPSSDCIAGILPSAPNLALSNVPEAGDFGLLYQLDIPNAASWTSGVPYTVDNSGVSLPSFNRVAYLLELDNEWVWVSMDAFTTDPLELGLPQKNQTGRNFNHQQIVNNMNVMASAGSGLANRTGVGTGNIEIWNDNYGVANGAGIPNASGSTFDWGDDRFTGGGSFSSFQIHDHGAQEVLMAYNRWGTGGTSDLGINNNTGNSHKDFTFMGNANGYTVKRLYVMVSCGGSGLQAKDVTVYLDANGQATVSPSQLDIGTIDNCGPVTLSVSPNTFDCSHIGANTVTLTATDGNGNTSTASAVVKVEDNLPPVAMCQDITVYLDANGEATATPMMIDGGSTDNCGPVTVEFATDNCTALAFDGVNDFVDIPTGVVQTLTDFTFEAWVDYTPNGSWARIMDFGNNTTVNMFLTPNPSDNPSRPRFAITVGGSGSAEERINSSVSISPGQHHLAVTLDYDPGTNMVNGMLYLDGVPVGNNNSMTLTPSSLGATVNNYLGKSQYNDPYFEGEMNNIRIWDRALTQAEVLTNMNACINGTESGLVIAYDFEDGTGSTVSDVSPNGFDGTLTNMDPNADWVNGLCCGLSGPFIFIPQTASLATFGCGDLGDQLVNLKITDGEGNVSFCSSTITVEDNTDPTAMCQNVTVQLDASGQASITTGDIDNGSSDNCTIVSWSLSQSSFDCTDLGVRTVTLTVEDQSGNQGTCTSTVTVEDNVPPTALCKDITVTLGAGGTASITGADIDDGSTDNCTIVSWTATGQTSYDCNDVGNTYTVTLTVEDQSGNTATCTSQVTVDDANAPVALCKDITVQLSNNGNAGITASMIDDGSYGSCGGVTLSASQTSFNCSHVGANAVVLTVTDIYGVQAQCTATVTVEDNIPPVAKCKDITIQLDAGGNASITAGMIDGGSVDNCGVQSILASQTAFDCTHIGMNNVTLTVTDVNGNQSTCTAKVTVEDVIPPVAKCQPITVQLDANGVATFNAAMIDNGSTDECGIVAMWLNHTSFTCPYKGTRNVILKVKDAGGNISACTTTVTVVDVIPPTPVCQDITIQLNTSGNASITASMVDGGSTDNCGVRSTSVSRAKFDCSNVGANTVILTVTDQSGNQSTCSATVTVQDGVPPTAKCKDITVKLDASGSASITASMVDDGSYANCGSVSLSINQTDFDCDDVGANTVTLTVTDLSGNQSTCTATVTVEDNMPPTIVCPPSIALNQPGIATWATPTTSDNCGPVTLTSTHTSGTFFPRGRHTVVYTATDPSGNVATCSFYVAVRGGKTRNDAIDPQDEAANSPTLKLWPNPTEGLLQIDLSQEGYAGKTTIELYDLLGRRVHATSNDLNDRYQLTLDIGHLAGGQYMLRIRMDETGEMLTRKVIVVR